MDDKPPTAAELFPVVYKELRKVARNYLGRERRSHTLQPTALVNEAWLRLRDSRGFDVQGRTHVLALGAKAMRQVLIDHGRRRHAKKRGNQPTRVSIDNFTELTSTEKPMSIEDALALDAAIARLESIDARQAEIVSLRYFAGLSVDEVAEHLGVSKRTVEGEWTHARAWLKRELTGKGATQGDPDGAD